MRAYERLLKYIQYETASDEASETCPSTPNQLVLARALVEELRALDVNSMTPMDALNALFQLREKARNI